jgi:ubiquinone biosynthesis monooxygenase Coq7
MLDSVIVEFDKALRTVFCAAPSSRSMPGQGCSDDALSEKEKVRAAALMRVNHVGEVCAQGMYQGQALTCHDPAIRQFLEKAAYEETEHLAWTERRIHELRGRTSLLNPFWYIGALSFGVFAGNLGDVWSLGFLAETERQVEAHLGHHLSELPVEDARSRAIVQQMKMDETSHAAVAVSLGAPDLPSSVKMIMRLAAVVMTRTAYYI